MIGESRYWKAELLRLATRLVRARAHLPAMRASTYVSVEKAVILGAFVIRKLADSNKLSDSNKDMLLHVRRMAASGKPVTLMNNHRLDELYNFRKTERCTLPLRDFCNQAIHSYILAAYVERSGRRIVGVYVASDRQRARGLFAVPLSELVRAFKRTGNDYPEYMSFRFDSALGDYRVSAGSTPVPPREYALTATRPRPPAC